MQIVSNGDNLHEMSKLFFVKNTKSISVCGLLKILPRVLSVKLPSILLEYTMTLIRQFLDTSAVNGFKL